MTGFGLMGVSLAGTPDGESAYVSWQNAVLPNPPYTGIQTRRVYYSGIPSGAYDNQIQICIDKGYKACVSFNPALTGTRTSNNLPSLAQMQTDQNAMVAYLNTIVSAFTTAGMTPISNYLAVTMAHEPTNSSSPAHCTAAQFQNIYSTAASGGLTNYAALHAICPVWIDLLGNTQGASSASSYFPSGFCDGFAVDYYGGNYIKSIPLTTFSNLADGAGIPFSIWETGNTAGTNFPTSTQMEEYLTFLASFFGGRILNSLPIGEIIWFQANGSSPGYNIISSSSDYRVPYLQALNSVLNPSSPPPPPPPPPSILPGPGGPVTITYGPASGLDAVLAASNMGQGSVWPGGTSKQHVALSSIIGTALMPNPDIIPATLLLQGSPPLQLPSGTAGWVLMSDASGNLTLQSSGITAPAQPVSFTPAGPASTASNTVPVMMGLGVAGSGQACVFTPAGTGHVRITITGEGFVASTGSTNLTCGGRYGTGTPPANGAANTGTSFGTGATDLTLRPTQALTGGNGGMPFSIQQIISVTPGTQIWADLAVQAPSGGNAASVGNLVVSFEELPS